MTLAGEPDNAYAHAMLALCLAEQKRYGEASEEAGRAVTLSPDLSFAHYVMAKIFHDRNRYDESLVAIAEAIRQEPYDPNYHGLEAAIHLERGKWAMALVSAERGLETEPDHDVCTNLRAMSLVKLGRRDEASVTIEGALQRDPEDAFAHANQGWAMLNRSQPKEAIEHFREALRLDPTLEWARAGIVEAMKARNVLYRWLLGYFLWMSRLSNRAQWVVIIGLYVAYQVMKSLAENNPALAPFIWPMLGLYFAFVLMTWLGEPLFNSLLRLDRLGRYALSDDQRYQSTALLGLMGLGIVLLIVEFGFGVPRASLGAVACLLMMFPVVAVFRVARGWPRTVMIAWALLLGLMASVSFTLLLIFPVGPVAEADVPPLFKVGFALIVVFVVGVAASMIAANLLSAVRPKR